MDLRTVNLSILVGRGIGPATMAPERTAFSIMSLEVSSMTLWSKDLILMRIFCFAAAMWILVMG